MRLLVSVVSPDEVSAALAGGADVVDVKNPAEGALGAAVPATLRAIRALVAPPFAPPLAPRPELSAALGDAPHLPGTLALAAYGAAACGVDYVKVGLLGSRHPREALQLLAAVRRAAEESHPAVRVVAVAYADAVRAGGLPPQELPIVAAAAGIRGILLDTYFKDGGSSFATLGERAIAAFLEAGRARGLQTGLAGSLGAPELRRARDLDVDIVGVRGSACDGGRGGTVSAARVAALRAALGLGAHGLGAPALSTPASPASSPAPAAPAVAPGAGR
jgi:uncharacterized protein (UPF0264 family)